MGGPRQASALGRLAPLTWSGRGAALHVASGLTGEAAQVAMRVDERSVNRPVGDPISLLLEALNPHQVPAVRPMTAAVLRGVQPDVGPPDWQDDAAWKGWWGPNAPFHTPTFVLTHRPRSPIEMAGGTTFHLLNAPPAEALDVAREAAVGQDVRIGGRPTVARDFIAAGLVDHVHLVQVCRSCSAVECGCGTASKRSRRTTTSSRSRHPAASPTSP